MLDFLIIREREGKRGVIEIVPDYKVEKSSDLMTRGQDFYAIYDSSTGFWSMDEDDAIRLIDRELDKYAEEVRAKHPDQVYRVLHLRTASTRLIKDWHAHVKYNLRDHYRTLNQVMKFDNEKVKKTDYVDRTLPYHPTDEPTPAWDKLLYTLYSEEDAHKIMWCIGSILAGASRDEQQKMLAFYGPGGSGKSTITKKFDKLFEGFTKSFSSKQLGAGKDFALEVLSSAPLVAIDSDGDLSKIEDNTLLNSIVSHDDVVVNAKFKALYTNKFKCFLVLASNKPVKITDARSGLIRRVIDVSPTGNLIKPRSEYDRLMEQSNFELGGIAKKALDIYHANPRYYDDYIPYRMINATNDFYNFVADCYLDLTADEEGIASAAAYALYQKWCDSTNTFAVKKAAFDEELRLYFDKCEDRHRLPNGSYPRNWYSGFRKDKIEGLTVKKPDKQPGTDKLFSLVFDSTVSLLDVFLADQLAQYGSTTEKPLKTWDTVTTTLSKINTRRLHYVKVPENLIVIDFDIPDENGEKSFEKNLEAASKWPPTYAELSKSGKGIHLHYIYDGDVSKLDSKYAPNIEIKVFKGGSSLRRKLTKCNTLQIATISTGLPLKKEKPMVSDKVIKTSLGLVRFIDNCLQKKYEPYATKPMVELIYSKLEECYANGLVYDVSSLRDSIRNFALSSTHNKEYCLKLVNKMKFKSAVEAKPVEGEERTKVIFDVEVFPNLFLICWKPIGPGKLVQRWFNPNPELVKSLYQFDLIGFNNRRYDNHILWAAGTLEFTPMQLYMLSQRIISGDKEAFFRDAYNLSYTDIYDFSALKQSLKRFEIDLKIDHKELGMKWDEPVPEDRWEEVADYCVNDVVSTEAVWNARQGDFAARKILVALANHGQKGENQ